MTKLIISNEEMDDIMNMVKSLEDAGLLLKDVSKTIKNKAKEQKDGFLSILLGTVDASLLRNLLTGKRVILDGKRVIATSRRGVTITEDQ